MNFRRRKNRAPQPRPSQTIDVPELTADPYIVKTFTEHLTTAFDKFINDYPGNVDYVDGFMAVHNLHKRVVGYLVEETKTELWWNMAVATFQKAVEEEMRQAGQGDQSCSE